MVQPQYIQPVPQAFQYMMPNQAAIDMAPPQPAIAAIGRWRGWRQVTRSNNKGENGNGSGKPSALPGDGDRVCAVCCTKHKDQSRTHCRNPHCQAKLKAVAVSTTQASNTRPKGNRESSAQEETGAKSPEPPSDDLPVKSKSLQRGEIAWDLDLPPTANEAKEGENQKKSIAAKKKELEDTREMIATMLSKGYTEEQQQCKVLRDMAAKLEKEITAANPDLTRRDILNYITKLETAKTKFLEDHKAKLKIWQDKRAEAEKNLAELATTEAARLKKYDDELAVYRDKEKHMMRVREDATTGDAPMATGELDADQQEAADALATLKLQNLKLQEEIKHKDDQIQQHTANPNQLYEKDEQIAHLMRSIENNKRLFSDFLTEQTASIQKGTSSQDLQKIQQLQARLAQEEQPHATRDDARVGPYDQPHT